jgi:hypothetical protein
MVSNLYLEYTNHYYNSIIKNQIAHFKNERMWIGQLSKDIQINKKCCSTALSGKYKWKTQWDTTLYPHRIAIRMKWKISASNVCMSLKNWWWECRMVRLFRKTFSLYLKWQNLVIPWSSNFPFRYLPMKMENIFLPKLLSEYSK